MAAARASAGAGASPAAGPPWLRPAPEEDLHLGPLENKRIPRPRVSGGASVAERRSLRRPPPSPAPPPRRRASSIGVTCPPPDLQRFLAAEVPAGRGRGPGARRPVSPCRRLPPPTTPARAHTPLVSDEPPRARPRTASMPAVARHAPLLGQMSARRAGTDEEPREYYRVRSFSITPSGIFNLGDSLRSRRSHSVASQGSCSTASSGESDGGGGGGDSGGGSGGGGGSGEQAPKASDSCSGDAAGKSSSGEENVPRFKVAMLGASGVGKTALACQFTTSEYICAYDTSLDEEGAQKSVSVLLDGREAQLEIVDYPAGETTVERCCSMHQPDVFVVVYSVVERSTLRAAEEVLRFLWKAEYAGTRGVILVGNKADLERRREVPAAAGRRLANASGCKFIETSSGLAHNVDELLVGVLAQVRLNPRRFARGTGSRRGRLPGSGRRFLRQLLGLKRKSRSCENLLVL